MRYSSLKDWEMWANQVWGTLRDFQTVLADYRASIKGFLSSRMISPSSKVGNQYISQLQLLLSIVEELELFFPTLHLSNGNFIFF